MSHRIMVSALISTSFFTLVEKDAIEEKRTIHNHNLQGLQPGFNHLCLLFLSNISLSLFTTNVIVDFL